VKSQHFKDSGFEGNVILKDVAGCTGLIWVRTRTSGLSGYNIPTNGSAKWDKLHSIKCTHLNKQCLHTLQWLL